VILIREGKSHEELILSNSMRRNKFNNHTNRTRNVHTMSRGEGYRHDVEKEGDGKGSGGHTWISSGRLGVTEERGDRADSFLSGWVRWTGIYLAIGSSEEIGPQLCHCGRSRQRTWVGGKESRRFLLLYLKVRKEKKLRQLFGAKRSIRRGKKPWLENKGG